MLKNKRKGLRNKNFKFLFAKNEFNESRLLRKCGKNVSFLEDKMLKFCFEGGKGVRDHLMNGRNNNKV